MEGMMSFYDPSDHMFFPELFLFFFELFFPSVMIFVFCVYTVSITVDLSMGRIRLAMILNHYLPAKNWLRPLEILGS
jgi:hypothetical protein